MLGSEAPDKPDAEAGPVRPMVAYVSSTKSGNKSKNAGLIPEAFQVGLALELNAPEGVLTMSVSALLPNTALMRSEASDIWT